jgi:putative endonuclease
LEKRINEHKSKSPKSAKYVRYFKSVELVYSEEHSSRSTAMKREAEIKRWTKAKKEILISSNIR